MKQISKLSLMKKDGNGDISDAHVSLLKWLNCPTNINSRKPALTSILGYMLVGPPISIAYRKSY